MPKEESNIIIYNSIDRRASVVLYARDGSVWMNQNQLAELFDTSIPNISMHIANVLLDGELKQDSVIKNYLTTAADGKQYNVTFYSLERSGFGEQQADGGACGCYLRPVQCPSQSPRCR